MKTIETFSGSEAMKEIEPQREGVFLCRLRLVLLINGCVVDEKSTANLLD